MMKKMYFSSAALLGAALMLSSCGVTQGAQMIGRLANMQQSQTGTDRPAVNETSVPSGSLLSGLLSGLLGSSQKLSAEAVVGTWQYVSPDCVFESDNLLMKAGGAVAASKVETRMAEELAKVGIKPGSCSFTFNNDGTYSAVINGRKLSGNYTIDVENKKMKMTYLGGLATMEPHVAVNAEGLSLLYESDKLLSLVSALSSVTGSKSGAALSQLLGAYDGMYIGMKLSK